jgi:hypothetical protein
MSSEQPCELLIDSSIEVLLAIVKPYWSCSGTEHSMVQTFVPKLDPMGLNPALANWDYTRVHTHTQRETYNTANSPPHIYNLRFHEDCILLYNQ